LAIRSATPRRHSLTPGRRRGERTTGTLEDGDSPLAAVCHLQAARTILELRGANAALFARCCHVSGEIWISHESGLTIKVKLRPEAGPSQKTVKIGHSSYEEGKQVARGSEFVPRRRGGRERAGKSPFSGIPSLLSQGFPLPSTSFGSHQCKGWCRVRSPVHTGRRRQRSCWRSVRMRMGSLGSQIALLLRELPGGSPSQRRLMDPVPSFSLRSHCRCESRGKEGSAP
jgi:hypothetical protein